MHIVFCTTHFVAVHLWLFTQYAHWSLHYVHDSNQKYGQHHWLGYYSETCLSDHLYAATTSLHRPQRKVPNDSYRKAPRTNSSTTTTCLMWTTTAHADNQRTKFSCQLRPVGVTIRRYKTTLVPLLKRSTRLLSACLEFFLRYGQQFGRLLWLPQHAYWQGCLALALM